MSGATIFLLLACGGLVIQARPSDSNANPNMNILVPRRNLNANANTNILSRRDSNINANTNILSRRNINANTNIVGSGALNANANLNIVARRSGTRNHPFMRYDEIDEGTNIAFQNMRRRIYNENEPSIASVAVAAGHAAFEVMNDFVTEMTEAAGNAVADVVATILRRRNATPYNRRNSNINANTNIISGGRSASGPTPPPYASEMELPETLFPFGHGNRFADPNADEEEDETENVENGPENSRSLKDNDILGSRTFGDHHRGRPKYDWRGNSDTNANANSNINSYPRKMNRNINANTNINVMAHRQYQE